MLTDQARKTQKIHLLGLVICFRETHPYQRIFAITPRQCEEKQRDPDMPEFYFLLLSLHFGQSPKLCGLIGSRTAAVLCQERKAGTQAQHLLKTGGSHGQSLLPVLEDVKL